MVTGNQNQSGNGNLLAVSLLIAATVWVGAVGALREVRRLVGSGYTVTEIQRLLGLTLSEKDDERARRMTDAVAVQQRKHRVRIAWAILLSLLIALFVLRQGADPSGQVRVQGEAAAIMFFAAFMAGALAIAILIASPFRRSISERLFNAVWLGAIGRTLFQMAAGRRREAVVAAGSARTVTAPASSAPDTRSLAAAVSRLEARVAALESRRE
jgi:hypothetical protein